MRHATPSSTHRAFSSLTRRATPSPTTRRAAPSHPAAGAPLPLRSAPPTPLFQTGNSDRRFNWGQLNLSIRTRWTW